MIKIALAGNPNAGKTTLFNALTGSNQFVGNWPGVTVEKKEGKLKGHNGDVVIMDLPGIYSLSPYTLEEVVSRDYLVKERPDAILNIVDGTNLERNLYLTTQLAELGIPMVVAVNMMDIVKKNGDKIHIEAMSKELGCPVMEISALKGTGCIEAAEIALNKANEKKPMMYKHRFEGCVEHALAHIEEAVVHDLPEEQHRCQDRNRQNNRHPVGNPKHRRDGDRPECHMRKPVPDKRKTLQDKRHPEERRTERNQDTYNQSMADQGMCQIIKEFFYLSAPPFPLCGRIL